MSSVKSDQDCRQKKGYLIARLTFHHVFLSNLHHFLWKILISCQVGKFLFCLCFSPAGVRSKSNALSQLISKQKQENQEK